jgi:hypothetical protein
MRNVDVVASIEEIVRVKEGPTTVEVAELEPI